jgi:hypothetical protein
MAWRKNHPLTSQKVVAAGSAHFLAAVFAAGVGCVGRHLSVDQAISEFEQSCPI